ncbi:ABC transporter permease [Aeromicrobium duanguangcaii]|uniref:Molybdenum transport system permease n=1 Tax=Aeromicrobium duanguangcaii TaxID=2968086 RepID=A0ABY5KAN2_9ACTN|nr:ABC transporter permease [Aeromicrobium duanguangcaii]UUI67504.1 ABC transporter permease [Aeromicrobium duanguangcaii]
MKHPDVPVWVLVPAVLGLALLVLPVTGLVVRVDWQDFVSLVTTEESRAALWLSLRTAATSTVLCLVLGVPLALVLARSSARWASVVRALVLLPLVLPPVVGGIALLATFGRRGWLGQHLEAFGIEIAFTTLAVVLAQTFVSLPFLVVTLEGALRAVDPGYADVAATLGAAPTRVVVRVSLPLVAPGLIAGTVLSFARALGEFGATVTFAGSLQGVTRALPTEIYLQREVDPDAAIALSFLLVAVALAVIALVHRPGRSPW